MLKMKYINNAFDVSGEDWHLKYFLKSEFIKNFRKIKYCGGSILPSLLLFFLHKFKLKSSGS